MALKYVIFEKPDGLPTVRLCDSIADHAGLVVEVQAVSPGLKVVSAGQLFRGQGELTCMVGSTTLKIRHNAERSRQDTAIINRLYEI